MFSAYAFACTKREKKNTSFSDFLGQPENNSEKKKKYIFYFFCKQKLIAEPIGLYSSDNIPIGSVMVVSYLKTNKGDGKIPITTY